MRGGNEDLSAAVARASIDNIEITNEKKPANLTQHDIAELDPEKELPDQDAQKGVKQAEAVSIVWSKTSMRIVFCSYVESYLPVFDGPFY